MPRFGEKLKSIGKKVKNAFSSTAENAQQTFEDIFGGDDVNELDEEQHAVADAILASGVQHWEWLDVIESDQGFRIRYLRLKRESTRLFSPFPFETCAIEICDDGYDPSSARDVHRLRIRKHVDRYVMIDSTDLIHYMNEHDSDRQWQYLFGQIPINKLPSEADMLFNLSEGYAFEVSRSWVFVSESGWSWAPVISPHQLTESRSVSQMDRRGLVVHDNPLYAATTSTHTSPIYQPPGQ